MQCYKADLSVEKGWFAGPWNSDLPISVGYALTGINEPHLHTLIKEIYLVGRGSSVIRVNQKTFLLSMGDMLVIEPGEAHTFLSSSPDYYHLVIHLPGLNTAEARMEKKTLQQHG